MDIQFCSQCGPRFDVLSRCLTRHDLLRPDLQQKWPLDIHNAPSELALKFGSTAELRTGLCTLCTFIRNCLELMSSENKSPYPENAYIVFTIQNFLQVTATESTNRHSPSTWIKSLGIYVFESEIASGLPTQGQIFDRRRLKFLDGLMNDNNIAGISKVARGVLKHHTETGMIPDKLYGSPRPCPDLCNIALFVRWLSICEETHCGECGVYASAAPPGIRLLDVNKLRLVIPKSDSKIRYCTLSYVWGSEQYICLTKENLGRLCDEGFDTGSSLHPAIAGAIEVVQKLSESYLWVDSLCIIQDDSLDKCAQIDQMGSVYAGSLLTIVAAGSDFNDLGLKGIGSNISRKNWPTINTQQACLVPRLKSLHNHHWSNNSIWASRAWTLQEYLLSPRKLIFGDNQVYWVCKSAEWREDRYLESDKFQWRMNEMYIHSPLTTINLSQLTCDCNLIYRRAFWNLAEYYSSQKLTFLNDRLSAIQGILKTIHRANPHRNHFWAMSTDAFEIELAWFEPLPFGEGRQYETLAQHFPSWSWLSYPRRISILGGQKYESFRPLIKCFKIHQIQGKQYRLKQISLVKTSTSACLEWYPVHVRLQDLADHDLLSKVNTERHISFWGNVARLEICWETTSGFGEVVIPGESMPASCRTNTREMQCGSTEADLLLAAEDEAVWGRNPVQAWSSTLDRSQRFYDFVAIGVQKNSGGEKVESCDTLLLLLDWKDQVAYRAGFCSLPSEVWAGCLSARQLILMG